MTRTTKKRQPPMSLELIGLLEHRRAEFRRKFGRSPHPGEPLFFDPDAPEPRRIKPSRRSDAEAAVAALTGLNAKMAADLVARW